MTGDLDPRVEEQITTWREYVSRRDAIDGRDVDELEDHLRGQIGRVIVRLRDGTPLSAFRRRDVGAGPTYAQ